MENKTNKGLIGAVIALSVVLALVIGLLVGFVMVPRISTKGEPESVASADVVDATVFSEVVKTTEAMEPIEEVEATKKTPKRPNGISYEESNSQVPVYVYSLEPEIDKIKTKDISAEDKVKETLALAFADDEILNILMLSDHTMTIRIKQDAITASKIFMDSSIAYLMLTYLDNKALVNIRTYVDKELVYSVTGASSIKPEIDIPNITFGLGLDEWMAGGEL